jgi:hypothetical protein
MEFIAFAIAIAVAYQALKGFRLSKERTLLYLNLSFVLIGAGLLIEGLTSLIVVLARFRFLSLLAVGYTINFGAQVIAYGLLVFAYIQQTRNLGAQAAMAAAPVFFFGHNPVTELILIFLIAYIAVQTAINYSINKSSSALLVFCAFAALTAAHIFFLAFTLVPIFFVFAHVTQLIGFLLLFLMLLRVSQAR